MPVQQDGCVAIKDALLTLIYNIGNAAGNFYYVDKDHLGNEQVYRQLDVPDPYAPPPPPSEEGSQSGSDSEEDTGEQTRKPPAP